MKTVLRRREGVELSKVTHHGDSWYRVVVTSPSYQWALTLINVPTVFDRIRNFRDAFRIYESLVFRDALLVDRGEPDCEGQVAWSPNLIFERTYPPEAVSGCFRFSKKRLLPNIGQRLIHVMHHPDNPSGSLAALMHEQEHEKRWLREGDIPYDTPAQRLREELRANREVMRRAAAQGAYDDEFARQLEEFVWSSIAKEHGSITADKAAPRIRQHWERKLGIRPQPAQPDLELHLSDKEWAMKHGLWDVEDEVADLLEGRED